MTRLNLRCLFGHLLWPQVVERANTGETSWRGVCIRKGCTHSVELGGFDPGDRVQVEAMKARCGGSLPPWAKLP